MADILIRGMKMPKDCPMCKLAHFNIFDEFTGCDAVPGKRYVPHSDYQFWNSAERPEWCPLLPLPEGHGDLIDRDAFRADNGLGKDCENCDRNTRNCNYDICLSRMDVCGWIDDAPTIVPAEGGTDNGN